MIKERRAGDVAVNYADVSKAESILGFKAKFSIKDACRESYNFERIKKIMRKNALFFTNMHLTFVFKYIIFITNSKRKHSFYDVLLLFREVLSNFHI